MANSDLDDLLPKPPRGFDSWLSVGVAFVHYHNGDLAREAAQAELDDLARRVLTGVEPRHDD